MDISKHDLKFIPNIPVTSAPSAAAKVAMLRVSSSLETSYRRLDRET
jgi:hypothetical protein